MDSVSNKRLYYKYSEYLKDTYGEKVYKLPINIDVTCPNRDGTLAHDGCIFCSEVGTGFENLSNLLSVKEQLQRNKETIGKKYNAKKFIAYFQNFTNTYMSFTSFKRVIDESIMDDIVEIAISTRPDCINDKYLEYLHQVKIKNNIKITIELGLQTVNYHTLNKINRGHGLAEFIDSVIRIRQFDFNICTHFILNLPWDDSTDVIESSKIVSILGVNQVKLHSLYIAKNTYLAQLYNNKEIDIITKEQYVNRVITFLEYLNPNIAVQRLTSRAPKEETLFCNWNTSWWKIKDNIENRMRAINTYQGKLYHYTNGKAIKEFTNI